MQKTLELFNKSGIIKKHTILEIKYSKTAQYLKARVELKNGDILQVKEYISSIEHLYSYHWQKENGDLIIRWDNSPHHRHIATFPHHKHSPDLEESYETAFKDVISFISKNIKKKNKKD